MDYDYDLEYESTLTKKLRLKAQIRATKQGDRSIQELLHVMVSLWDQMACLEPEDLMNSSKYRKFQEQNHVMQFLLALRDDFEPFKNSLLSRDLVPSLQEVVSDLKAEEARLKSSSGHLKGKMAVKDDYRLVSKFSSLSMKAEDHHVPASSGGSRAVADYMGSFEESDSSRDLSTIKILTYNVCFWHELELYERMKAVGRLIQLHKPDIICFQEVTPMIYNIFRQYGWWSAYNSSVSLEETRGRIYFCMQLSKLPVRLFSRKPFRNSSLGRELCIAEIEICRGKSLIVATSQLEGPTPAPPDFIQVNLNSEERVAQAKEAVNFLQSSKNVIFCGDMYWDDQIDGQFPFPHGWVDAWVVLRPGLEGWTYDTKSNEMLVANIPKQKRYDRFLCKLDDFKLENISMIGTEEIPGVSYLKDKRVGNKVLTLELPVLPSEHFGLLLEIHSN